MTELLRPSLYGAQHPVVHVAHPDADKSTKAKGGDYVIVGHCCESGTSRIRVFYMSYA